jgi:hypothetical protein
LAHSPLPPSSGAATMSFASAARWALTS